MKKHVIILLVLYLLLSVNTNAQSWLLNGNNGTTASNFLGTKDAKALVFRTNNIERMRILSTGNAGIGTNSPLQKLDINGNLNIKKGFGLYMENHRVFFVDSINLNTFSGNAVGRNNTSGSLNTAIGSLAFSNNTTGYSNTAAGALSLNTNTTGYQNTAYGHRSLASNTTGSSNTANGDYALYSNSTGFHNTATGEHALYLNQTGSYNTAYGANTLYFNKANYNSAAGSYAMYSNTTGEDNTAYGYASLYSNITGQDNVAVGKAALYINQIGTNNVAVGESALYYSQGHGNTAIGSSALYSTSNAFGANTAVGDHALYAANSSFNTAMGSYVMYKSTSGSHNVAMGYGTMGDNTTGDFNTAIGTFAMDLNVTGRYNAAVGSYGLFRTTNSWGNAALGYGAGQTYDNGYYNTFIGSYTNAAMGDIYNSTALGNAAIVSAPGQVRIGNSLVGSIGGYSNWSNISDGRVKKNVKENVPGLAFINKLKPVTYNLDLDAAEKIVQPPARKDKDGKIMAPSKQEISARTAKQQVIYTGFVAQEVEKAAKEMNYDFSGVDAAKNDKDLYALRYSEFVVPLVKAVQELSEQNKEMQKEIENLKALLAQKNQDNSLALTGKPILLPDAVLSQNTPNPFNSITTINYVLPQQFTAAKIIVTDNNGKPIKEINLSGNSKGSITIDASSLVSGIYSYAMYIDGKQAQSKKMIIHK